MRTTSYLLFALLLPIWLVGKLYATATRMRGIPGACMVLLYSIPAIKLFADLAPSVSLAWPVFWIPIICCFISQLIDQAALTTTQANAENTSGC